MQANTNVIKGLHLIGKQENEENRVKSSSFCKI